MKLIASPPEPARTASGETPVVAFPAGHLSTTPAALAAVAKRSMCPTCEDREPGPDEEAYAACMFCAA